MFIKPTVAIENGWITFPPSMSEDQRIKCIQPNAIDITIDSIRKIQSGPCKIAETNKVMRDHSEKLEDGINGFWTLDIGAYDFMSEFYVNLPEGVAAQVVARSTFVRNGLFVTTGLWDSGFQGPAGGVLHVTTGVAVIEYHVRVAQLIFVRTDPGGLYQGGYNTNIGQHWSDVLKPIQSNT